MSRGSIHDRETAQARAGQRVRLIGNCTECGKSFVGTSRRRFCSQNCRCRAYNRRRYLAQHADRQTVLV